MVTGSPAERGRALEQRVAAYFRSHGYDVRTNQVLVGRSGGRHEIDVLAEKSDALTSFRVAIECKAWNTPVEKDVVSKLHYVMGDLGLHKGVVVSLAGTRSGAEAAAQALGIDVWGPGELRHHLGESIFAEVDVARGAQAGAGRLILGWPFRVDVANAQRVAAEAGRGRFGIRSLESLTAFAPLWVPGFITRLTVAQPSVGRLRKQLTSRSVVNVYDGMEGEFLGPVGAAPVELSAGEIVTLKALRRESQVRGVLEKTVEARRKVTSPAAAERHDAKLRGLGLPIPLHSLSIDRMDLVHLPVYVGLLRGEQDRVVAVHGGSGTVNDRLSRMLTGQISQIHGAFAR